MNTIPGCGTYFWDLLLVGWLQMTATQLELCMMPCKSWTHMTLFRNTYLTTLLLAPQPVAGAQRTRSRQVNTASPCLVSLLSLPSTHLERHCFGSLPLLLLLLTPLLLPPTALLPLLLLGPSGAAAALLLLLGSSRLASEASSAAAAPMSRVSVSASTSTSDSMRSLERSSSVAPNICASNKWHWFL